MKYALVTAAHNEEKLIRLTLNSVVDQTIRPSKWMIMNDGSTDSTGEIIDEYCAKFDFIEHIRLTPGGEKHFGSKVRALMQGYNKVQWGDYDFVGTLDADVSFDTDYFQTLMLEFKADPRLGLAGGIITEPVKDGYKAQKISSNSVAGAVQFFRIKCFRDVGGFVELPLGGEDAVAEITARMKGWKVKTFDFLRVFHHRPVRSGSGGIFKATFKWGIRDYMIGYHPLFYVFVCMNRLFARPIIVAAVCRFFGYWWAAICSKKRMVSCDFVHYLQSEQLTRLRTRLSLH